MYIDSKKPLNEVNLLAWVSKLWSSFQNKGFFSRGINIFCEHESIMCLLLSFMGRIIELNVILYLVFSVNKYQLL